VRQITGKMNKACTSMHTTYPAGQHKYRQVSCCLTHSYALTEVNNNKFLMNNRQ